MHGRNLNQPTFDGVSDGAMRVSDITLEQTVTAAVAVAVDPVPWATLELDVGLMPYARLNGRTEWQTIGLGAELRAWRAWALRAGCYTNIDISSRADEDLAFTLGAGFAGRRARFEAAIGLAPETIEYREYEIPKQLRASLGFGFGF